MRLPISVYMEGTRYDEAAVKAPTPGCLADTSKELQEGRLYAALSAFVAGGITELTGTATASTPSQIKAAVRQMPFKSVEAVSIDMLRRHYGGEDRIEGVYPCPRCGHKIIEGVESEDRLSGLECRIAPDGAETFRYTFPEQWEMRTKEGELISTVNEIELDYPTMVQCQAAESRCGSGNAVRLQMAIFCNALRSVDGEPINDQYRAGMGRTLFEQIPTARDMQAIAKLADEYGMVKTADKRCPDCGREWKAVLNTSNFFASALRD